MISVYNEVSLPGLYDGVAEKNRELGSIIQQYGYPPLWVRPNTLATLVLTILEQQVSLASAYAAYKRLQIRLDDITPTSLLTLTDDELRACSFTRQKIVYVRGLAAAILSRQIDLEQFAQQPDDEVRTTLKQLKGIGDWTVDIYLLHALQRTDIFPVGDLALVNAIRMLRNDPALTKEAMLEEAEGWRPYRSMAAMLYWHYYIQKKGIKLLH
jgi:DNA-3-methyladenine glycosylase II